MAYEGQLEGMRVVPIQAITAVINIIVPMAGTDLFLKSYHGVSLMVTVVGIQVRYPLQMIPGLNSDLGRLLSSPYQVD